MCTVYIIFICELRLLWQANSATIRKASIKKKKQENSRIASIHINKDIRVHCFNTRNKLLIFNKALSRVQVYLLCVVVAALWQCTEMKGTPMYVFRCHLQKNHPSSTNGHDKFTPFDVGNTTSDTFSIHTRLQIFRFSFHFVTGSHIAMLLQFSVLTTCTVDGKKLGVFVFKHKASSLCYSMWEFVCSCEKLFFFKHISDEKTWVCRRQ